MSSNILKVKFTCSCLHQYQDVKHETWSPPPCPFPASQALVTFPGRQSTVYRKLVCDCGNEVGLVVHSSSQRVGYWKLSPKLIEQNRRRQMNYEIQLYQQLMRSYKGIKEVQSIQKEIELMIEVIERKEVER